MPEENKQEVKKGKTKKLVPLAVGTVMGFTAGGLLGLMGQVDKDTSNVEIFLRSLTFTAGYNLLCCVYGPIIEELKSSGKTTNGWDGLYITPGLLAGLYCGMMLKRLNP